MKQWIRTPEGKLERMEVPTLECPVRNCKHALEYVRSIHQVQTNNIAWILADIYHEFFVIPNNQTLIAQGKDPFQNMARHA